jgi:peptidoglycan/LPS O-acetylase OafA/YrhL
MYLSIFRAGVFRRLMCAQLITLIGGMCYSIYLMHNLVIVAVGSVWRRMMPAGYLPAALLSCLIMLPSCLIVSAIYFRLIERPCMRRDWPQRLWGWFMAKMFVEVPEAQK